MADKKIDLLSCSSSENKANLPHRDADSQSDLNRASPIWCPFTQDSGTGVVGNFYRQEIERGLKKFRKNKFKRLLSHKLNEKYPMQGRVYKPNKIRRSLVYTHIKRDKNLEVIMEEEPLNITNGPQLDNDDTMSCLPLENSPETKKSLDLDCLRKNFFISNVNRHDNEYVESDDSMNNALDKSTVIVDNNILNKSINTFGLIGDNTTTKSNDIDAHTLHFESHYDSDDYLMADIVIESSEITKFTSESISSEKDSFNSIIKNLSECSLECPTQTKINVPKDSNESSSKNLVSNIPLSTFFGQHNTLSGSPLSTDNKPSSSRMVIDNFNFIPYKKSSKTDNTP